MIVWEKALRERNVTAPEVKLPLRRLRRGGMAVRKKRPALRKGTPRGAPEGPQRGGLK